MLSLVVGSASLLHSPAPPLLGLTAQTAPRASVRLYDPYDDLADITEERAESAKAGFITSIAGSLAASPVKASALIVSNNLYQQWQYSSVALAVQLAFFGIVYRYAVRSDDNDMLKAGAVGGFVMCHTLSSPQILSQFSGKSSPDQWKMWIQLGASFGESVIVFGLAAAALEWAFNRGWLYRLPGYSGLPQRDEYFGDFFNFGRDRDTYNANYRGGRFRPPPLMSADYRRNGFDDEYDDEYYRRGGERRGLPPARERRGGRDA